jgi:hypothetical protein
MRFFKIIFWLITFLFLINSKANEIDEKVIIKGDTTKKLGGTVQEAPWSYSFINLNHNSKQSIFNQDTGIICFEDDNWLVAVQESKALNDNTKSEISFYDSKTLRTIAVARVPNCIEKIGRIPGSDFFYFLTKKIGKYNYDDAPLSLILIDPLNDQLERIKIVEGDHWLANEPIAVIPNKSKLTIKLPSSRFDEYKKLQLQNKYFSKIKLNYSKGSEIAHEFLFSDSVKNDIGLFKIDEKNYTGIKRKSLNYFDSKQKYLNSSSQNIHENRVTGLNTSRKTSIDEIMLARPLSNGELQSINISKLSSNNFKVLPDQVYKLGFFDSGLLYAVNKESIYMYHNDKIYDALKIKLDNHSRVSFDKNFAYISNYTVDESFGETGHPSGCFGLNSFEWKIVSQNGSIEKKKFNDASLIKLSKFDDYSIFPSQNILIKNSRPRFFISEENDEKMFMGWNGEGGDNIFSVYSIKDSTSIIDNIKTSTYFYGNTSDTKVDFT